MKPKSSTSPSTDTLTTASATTEETMRQYITLLLAGNDKGGIGKSTTTANVADGLNTLGYKVRLVDGDGTNETLQDLVPGIEQLRYKSEIAMNDFIGGLRQRDEDIVMVDLPGDSGEVLADYFTPARIELLKQNGIRLVIGLTLTQHMDSTRGAVVWAETFHGQVDFIGLANGSETPIAEQFSLENVNGGDDIAQIIENRLIVVPRFGDLMLHHQSRRRAVPSAYLGGGEAARELNFNFIDESPWRTHHQAVVASVAAHAVWLTGKPIPKPEFAQAEPPHSAKRTAAASSLRKAVKK
ncbi:MAG: AAA family ATPase [Chthoniobacterales bacterium]|nr:AAA family ATPase [Chthoniobacterales bacterium]